MKYIIIIPIKIILIILWVPLLLLSSILYIFGNDKFIYYITPVEGELWDLPEEIINKLSTLKYKRMKTKYLFQALKFACLPTLSVLLLIVCGFFSITKALDWISSDSGFAIALRIILVLAEIALVVIMYFNYEEEGEEQAKKLAKEQLLNNPSPSNNGNVISNRREVCELFGRSNYNDTSTYTLFTTKDSNILMLQINPATKK